MLLVNMAPSIKLKCQEKSKFSCLDHSSLGLTINIKLLTSFVHGSLKREEIELNKNMSFPACCKFLSQCFDFREFRL